MKNVENTVSCSRSELAPKVAPSRQSQFVAPHPGIPLGGLCAVQMSSLEGTSLGKRARETGLFRAGSTENLSAGKKQRLQGSPEAVDLTLDSPRFNPETHPARPVQHPAAPSQHAVPSFALGFAARPADAYAARPQCRPVRPPTPLSPEVVVLEERAPPPGHRPRPPAATAAATAWSPPAPTSRAQAGAAAAAAQEPDEVADAAVAKQLQEEEDRQLAAAEAAIARRMDELEAAEAAAAARGPGGQEGLFPGFGWPFGRRAQRRSRQPLQAQAAEALTGAGAGAAQRSRGVSGPRSRGRRSRWGDPSPFGAALAEVLAAGAALGAPGTAQGPGGSSNLLAHVLGAQHSSLPAHLLFSNRDFNEQDYELLLRLDDTVENRKGASQAAIDSLGTVRVPRPSRQGVGGDEDSQLDDCAVCLEACCAGEVVRRLPCGHSYHVGCIDRWLQTKAACPVCQQSIE